MSVDPAVIAATVAKLKEASENWQTAQTNVEAAETAATYWKAAQEQANQVAQQCFATAALFGFDLTQAYNDPAFNGAPSMEVAAPLAAAPASPPKLNMTIREYILQEARAALPGPVHAAAMRGRLKEQYGVEVHEKTFGMTLYRLSKEKPPLMRREGRQDWYFVPEDPETAEKRLASELFS